jgi:hypothetical protein
MATRDQSPIARVSLEARSWAIADEGLYSFEATVDGKAAEVRIAEDVAFDRLGAWTMSREKCLDILRLHRAGLAKSLERKLQAVGFPDLANLYFLTLDDIERANPAARDRQRASRSEVATTGGLIAAQSSAPAGTLNGSPSNEDDPSAQ